MEDLASFSNTKNSQPKKGKRNAALVLGILSYIFMPFHLSLSYFTGGGIGYSFELFSQAGNNDWDSLMSGLGGVFIFIVFLCFFILWLAFLGLQTIFGLVQFILKRNTFTIVTFVISTLVGIASLILLVIGFVNGEAAVTAIIDLLESGNTSNAALLLRF